MPNSAVVTKQLQKEKSKDTIAPEVARTKVNNGQPASSNSKGINANPVNLPKGPIKRPLLNKVKKSIEAPANTRATSPEPTVALTRGSSAASLNSRPTDAESEDVSAAGPKLRTKFTRPRLNKLTEQRVQRLRSTLTEAGNAGQAGMPASWARTKKKDFKTRSLTSMKSARQEIVPLTCPELQTLQKQLEDMQSEFMRKAAGFQQQGYSNCYKLVTIVHNDNCRMLVHNDDLLGLPQNLPAQTAKDFKQLVHAAFDASSTFICDQMASVQLAADEVTAATKRDELRNKLQSELHNNLTVVDDEIVKLCRIGDKMDASHLMSQLGQLRDTNDRLRNQVRKQELELSELRKERVENKKSVDTLQNRNKDLAMELASINVKQVEQNVVVEDLRIDIKHLKKINKTVQQRLKENEESLEQSKQTISKHLEQLREREEQLQQAQSDRLFLRKKSEELTRKLTERDRQIVEHKQQVSELEQFKDWQQTRKDILSNDETKQILIVDLQADIKRKEIQLSALQKTEEMLRDELSLKETLLQKAELKQARLEEQNEQNRQVLAVRSERITYLDALIKQRDQQIALKFGKVMAETSDSNTIIMQQMTNELASTNGQIETMCNTLSERQTQLHTQEHIIQLLEENNERSLKLHTKMSAKNALLKDELEHLRRTVNNLTLGEDMDVEIRRIRRQ